MIYIIKNFLKTNHTRSKKIIKNILVSFGLKGSSIVISFLLVPLTLNYLNPTNYGIWLTINALVGWFSFFDVGLGNGLRNKLSEAFAKKDYTLAKTYISTTYASIVIIISSIYVIFLSFRSILNWPKILNIPASMAEEISLIILVVFSFFAIRLILKLIGVILSANQLPAYNTVFEFLGNFTVLTAIYIIAKTSNESMLLISIAYSASPVIILFFASIYFFQGKYKNIKPTIKSINFLYFKSLAGLGAKFFILQIIYITIFCTDNMIIIHALGPNYVPPYNIAFKYFNIPIILFTIIITPFWSAFTEAITNNDKQWIQNAIKKLLAIWILIIFSVLLLLAGSKYFYLFWVGKTITIPFLISAFMGFFVVISTWNNIFASFLNGAGKIRLQIYCGIVGMIINIPISIFFAKNLNLGGAGVILGTCCSLSFIFILGPLQYLKIMNNTAKGIWNK